MRKFCDFLFPTKFILLFFDVKILQFFELTKLGENFHSTKVVSKYKVVWKNPCGTFLGLAKIIYSQMSIFKIITYLEMLKVKEN